MNKQIELAEKLKTSICKIRCLTFFIETQDPDHSRPIDFDEIQYGVALLLDNIVSELSLIKDQLEK